MALEHVNTTICEKLLRDSEGRFSLIGSFINIRAARLPITQKIAVYSIFKAPQGAAFTLSLVDPNGERVVLVNETVTPPEENLHEFQLWRVIVAMEGEIAFRQPGVFAIALECEGDEHLTQFGVFPAPEEPAVSSLVEVVKANE